MFLGDRALRRQRLRRLTIVVAALLTAVILGWLVWFSPLLAVTSVRVVGADPAQAVAVTSAAAIPIGEPMARIDAGGAQAAVLSLPWVASAEIRRGWPHEVVIAVTPKVVVAMTPDKLAVASDGATFPLPSSAVPSSTVPSSTVPSLPTLTAQGEARTAAAQVLGALPDDLRIRVRAASAGTPDSVDLTLRSGATVHWGSADQAVEKIQVLRALLAHRAQVYDVTAPGLPTTWRAG